MPYEYNPLTGQFEFIPYTPGQFPSTPFLPGLQPPALSTGDPSAIPFGTGTGPGTEPQSAPLAGGRLPFAQRRPRLASYLSGLGPALAALGQQLQQPPQTTPYPVSGLTGVLQALGGGAQVFGQARQNIEQAELGRLMRGLRRGPAFRGATEAIGAGTELTPAQAQAFQLVTGQPVETVAERARRTGGALTAGQEAEVEAGKAERELKDRIAFAQLQLGREELAANIERWAAERGIEKDKLSALKDEAIRNQNAKIAAIVNDQPYTDRGRQQPIIEKMAAFSMRGEIYTPTDEEAAILRPMQPPSVTAAAIRSAARRTSQDLLVKLIENDLERAYGANWLQNAPRDVLNAYQDILNPVMVSEADVNFDVADKLRGSFSVLKKAGHLSPDSESIFMKLFGLATGRETSPPEEKPETGVLGRKAAPLSPKEEAATNREGILREYETLYNAIQAGTATAEDIERARQLLGQLR